MTSEHPADWMAPLHRTDCRHFDGTRPCTRAPGCNGCVVFEAPGPRVLLILRGRLGDVVMATSLATAVARQTRGSHLTWLTDGEAAPLIKGHPAVQRVLVFDPVAVLILEAERFDLVVNLDRSPSACALAMRLDTSRRAGFGYDPRGTVVPMDAATVALFDINRYPDRRAANRHSWAALHHAIAGLDPDREPPLPSLHLDSGEETAAAAWRRRLVPDGGALVLCCVGSHANDPQKRWPAARWQGLWASLDRFDGVRVAVHAGPHEEAFYERVVAGRPADVHAVGVATDLRATMVRVRAADAVVTGDSLVLHLAMALGRPVVGLFGPTNPAFVQRSSDARSLRGRPDCPPCHARTCRHVAEDEPRPCLAEITPEAVAEALAGLLAGDRASGGMAIPEWGAHG